MLKKIKFLIVFLVITFLNVNFCVWAEKIETLKNLKNQVEQIDNSKLKQEEKLKKLKKELIIQKFFKEDLTDSQKEQLKIIVLEYKENKEKLESHLKKLYSTNKVKTIKKLLENEKEIYKKLLPYINKQKYEEYKEFIKEDIRIVNEKLFLEVKKTETQKKIEEKLKIIKTKIKKHRKFIDKKIEEIINKKIEEKLINFTQKEAFQKLTNNQKKEVFKKLENKFKERLKRLKENNNINQKQIEIYEIIIDKIWEFKDRF